MVLLPEHLSWQAHHIDSRIQNMVKSIIEPLRYVPDAEGFQDIIDDVESQLHAGLLRTPREVEVVLIINGRVSVSCRISILFKHSHSLEPCQIL